MPLQCFSILSTKLLVRFFVQPSELARYFVIMIDRSKSSQQHGRGKSMQQFVEIFVGNTVCFLLLEFRHLTSVLHVGSRSLRDKYRLPLVQNGKASSLY